MLVECDYVIALERQNLLYCYNVSEMETCEEGSNLWQRAASVGDVSREAGQPLHRFGEDRLSTDSSG